MRFWTGELRDRRRARLAVAALALVAAAALIAPAGAALSGSIVIRPKFTELPYVVGSPPLLSGRYVLLSLGGASFGDYVVVDDQTGKRTTLHPSTQRLRAVGERIRRSMVGLLL